MAVTGTSKAAKDRLFSLPPTVAGRRRMWLIRICGIGGIVILIAGSIVTWKFLVSDPSCAEGVARIDGECIGVSAGDFQFNRGDTRFSAAEERIRQLNRKVEKSGQPYVTVALLTSLTWTAKSDLSRAKIIHQVEGAAVALDRVNNEAVTGHSPQIELKLANEGTNEDHYGTVVQQLIGMRTGRHPLDAVIGLGVSKGATKAGAKKLSDAGIPLVASNLTGDGLDSSQVPGLSRVSPPNSDDVAAIAAYIKSLPERPATMLVHAVQKKGDRADYYTSTLTDDFKQRMGGYQVAPAEPFDPTEIGNSFGDISTNLCTHNNEPDTVLYAGREPDLPEFIGDLAQRTCADEPITLVAGTDSCSLLSGSDNPERITSDMAKGHVTVLCPAWAAPRNWAASKSDKYRADPPAGFSAFANDYQAVFTAKRDFGTELDDGYAIMTHDALLTAAKEIRLSAGRPVKVPKPAQVLGSQFHMDAANTVRGASGTFTFVEQNNGNPAGKPVFVLRIGSSGPPVQVYKYPGE